MDHDRDYFRRRAAEARAAASHKGDDEGVEVAGHLALAYAALARRARPKATEAAEAVDAIARRRPAPIMFSEEAERLKPAAPLEDTVRQHCAQQASAERPWIAGEPFQLGHMLEIHAVDARDQGRRKEDQRRHRKHFQRRILLDADQAERSVEQEGQIGGEKGAVVDQRADVGASGSRHARARRIARLVDPRRGGEEARSPGLC